MAIEDHGFEQQRDIGKAFREIADLRGDVKEIRTAVIGIDGKNGIRGELRDFIILMDKRMTSQDSAIEEIKKQGDARMDKIEDEVTEIDARVVSAVEWGQNVWEVQRHLPGQCIGKAALEEYEARVAKEAQDRKEERRVTDSMAVELKKSRNAMNAVILAALITALASMATTLISKQSMNERIDEASKQVQTYKDSL